LTNKIMWEGEEDLLKMGVLVSAILRKSEEDTL
jgi:hypothetical protein